MHIALYSPAWPPAKFPNGIVTYVHWVREELMRRGHRVSVVAGVVSDGDHGPDVHAVTVSPLRRVMGRVFSRLGFRHDPVLGWGSHIARRLSRLHRREPIDLMEMEESFGWAAAVMALRRFPVVIKLHGPAFLSLIDEELDGEMAHKKIAAEGRCLVGARALTSPSMCTLEDTTRRYGLKVPLAAHVVNPLTADPAAPSWSPQGSRRDSVLFVGRFDKRKGGDRVLECFRRLLDVRPAAELVFIGPDQGLTTPEGGRVHFEAYAARLFSAAQRQQIRFLGSQPPQVIAELRSKASVVVVASRWESQGYTLLEAMQQGCPVVCANNSALSESVVHGRTGLLFASDDIDDMTRQVLAILDDRTAAERLGREARAHVLHTHGAAEVVDKMLAVYQTAIKDFGPMAAARKPRATPSGETRS